MCRALKFLWPAKYLTRTVVKLTTLPFTASTVSMSRGAKQSKFSAKNIIPSTNFLFFSAADTVQPLYKHMQFRFSYFKQDTNTV